MSFSISLSVALIPLCVTATSTCLSFFPAAFATRRMVLMASAVTVSLVSRSTNVLPKYFKSKVTRPLSSSLVSQNSNWLVLSRLFLAKAHSSLSSETKEIYTRMFLIEISEHLNF